jgi:hypothetical protein
VDGGSTDQTLGILRDWAARTPLPATVRSAPGTNISAGRNVAIAAATGDIIAVTDGGAIADPRWLEELCEGFADGEADAVSGFYVAGGETWFERTLTVAITPQLAEIDPEDFLPSSRSVAFTKAAWEAVGGYPEWLDHCEDLVFDLALRRAGGRFAFRPSGVVTWNGRSSLWAFGRQYFLYARGDGIAGLWPLRHAARYSAYAVGPALLVLGASYPPLLLVAAAGLVAHCRRSWVRLRRAPPSRSAAGRAAAYLLVPAIVVTGDLAKMAGYVAGRALRRRRLTAAGKRRRWPATADLSGPGGGVEDEREQSVATS